MNNYTPRRDFIGALLACLGMIALLAAFWVATPN